MYVITTDKTRHEVRKMLHKIRNATLLILLVAIIDHPLKVLAADGFNLPSQWKLFEFGDQTSNEPALLNCVHILSLITQISYSSSQLRSTVHEGQYFGVIDSLPYQFWQRC